MSNAHTKERILDTAEHLFAHKGFHNTSLRNITNQAGVNLAAVNYHFGSKEALLQSVFERRLIPLNQIRFERLQHVREKAKNEGRPPGVEETLRAFIEPTLRFSDADTKHRDFIVLVGRALSETDDTLRNLFIKIIWQLFILLFETLCEALPDLEKDCVFHRLQFALGAMGHVMSFYGKVELKIEGIPVAMDNDTLINAFIQFVTAGMEAR